MAYGVTATVLVAVLGVPVTNAVAAPSAPQTVIATSGPGNTVEVTGNLNGRTLSGTASNLSAAVVNGKAVLKGTISGAGLISVPFTATADVTAVAAAPPDPAAPPAAAPPAAAPAPVASTPMPALPPRSTAPLCEVLALDVDNLHLDLLGLKIVVPPPGLHVIIAGQDRPGALLGTLLCALAGGPAPVAPVVPVAPVAPVVPVATVAPVAVGPVVSAVAPVAFAVAPEAPAPVAPTPVAPAPAPQPAAPQSAEFPLTVTRTGGFAGFQDVLVVAADGMVSVTHKGQPQRHCQLTPEVVGRLIAAASQVPWPRLIPASTQPAFPDDMVSMVLSPAGGPARLQDPRVGAAGQVLQELLTDLSVGLAAPSLCKAA